MNSFVNMVDIVSFLFPSQNITNQFVWYEMLENVFIKMDDIVTC